MSLRSLLESFDSGIAASPAELASPGADVGTVAAARSEGYEAGYASGWEDAHTSDQAARERIAAEFERNIEALAFTYHEAVDLVRAEVFDFVEAVIEGFLPAILPELTREHLREALRKHGEDLLHAPVDIVVSSDCRDVVAEMMSEDFALELNLVEDPTLAPHQVFLRFAQTETAIDLAPVAETLRAQLTAMKPSKERPANARR
jgi:flagellar assembly protein FliH